MPGQRDDSLHPLLLSTLRDLRSAVDRVQDGQDQLRDRIDESIRPIEARVSALEKEKDVFKAEVKRDARTWGAAGGVGAVVTAGLALFVKTVTGK